jgi:S1-C subfamily serine protease
MAAKKVTRGTVVMGWRLAACLALGLMQGCAPAAPPAPPPPTANNTGPITSIREVKINGVTYSSEAAALEGRREDKDKLVAGLTREPDPIKGRAAVIVPDRDRLRPLIAQTEQQLFKRPVAGEALEFFVDEAQQDMHETADALVRSNAFESVTVTEQNDVLAPDIGSADFLVWYQVRTVLPNNTGQWIGRWLVRRAGNPTESVAIPDVGTAVGTPRLASLVKSMREDALRLGGKSVSGVTAASLANGGNAAGAGVSGSGIIVDTEGYLVTNEHVIRSCTQPSVTDSAQVTYRASIVAKDAVNDLALLKVEHHWPQAASFRDGHEPRPGDSIVVTGYPLHGLLGSGMAVTTGSLTALTGPRDDSRLLQLSAPIQPGNSGGPLLDNDGHVIGIVSSTLNGIALAGVIGALPQNVNFAINATIVRNFLDTQNIDYASAASGHELSSGDIGGLARKFTVRIECGAS